jgi:formate dehydrogenase iron-sulfur subunit
MELSRRTFFKVAGVAGATGLAGGRLEASPQTVAGAGASAVLVDTTRCIGCRACEAACSEVNRLPAPIGDPQAGTRKTDSRTFTVVSAMSGPGGESHFVKQQCNHCLEPGCASACPVKAIEKTATGPVVYHEDRCIGCRYCMLACPFEIPKYEYEKAAPYVRKCEFCAERQARGLQPACASVCPSGALTFGTRAELIEEARTRIYQNPDRYVHHVYGEHEVGGTSWLYLSDVTFDQIGLRTDLGLHGFAELTQASLAAVPFVITLWPPFLMALYTFSKRREDAAHEEASHE